MRLRARFAEHIKARLDERMPEALATVWDSAQVVCVIESLKFTGAGGYLDPDWRRELDFEGVLRVELHADGIDTLVFEPLLADLIETPPVIRPDEATEAGRISEKARAVLIELRDAVREREVVTALRFGLKGCIVTRDPPPMAPEAMIGRAPKVGPDHVEDYQSLDEWTGAG